MNALIVYPIAICLSIAALQCWSFPMKWLLAIPTKRATTTHEEVCITILLMLGMFMAAITYFAVFALIVINFIHSP